MKKIMAAVIAASIFYCAPAKADDSQLILSISGFIDGVAVGGTYVKRKHRKKRYYYEEQGYYPPPPPPVYEGGYDEGYAAPPPAPGGCTFKSKMQGRVKCGPGMPPPQANNYPPPGYGQPYPGQYPGQYGLPMVNPVLCQPFYYQEFVPGYGWQTLRNYRC